MKVLISRWKLFLTTYDDEDEIRRCYSFGLYVTRQTFKCVKKVLKDLMTDSIGIDFFIKVSATVALHFPIILSQCLVFPRRLRNKLHLHRQKGIQIYSDWIPCTHDILL